ncbi:polysaccharide biosynthesis protein [Lactiplantibacillus plantarum]|nr:polysaccharide biosynthesis protein [Lactiplantibacillus plantarum]
MDRKNSKGRKIVLIHFVLRFHDDTPSGGRKILYEYANYLAERGHQICITFVADTPFRARKWNQLATIKHFRTFLLRKKFQNHIDWFKLNKTIKVNYCFSTKKISKRANEILLAFDYGIALSLGEQLDDFTHCFYLIQHDEKVYYDKKIVRQAWKLPYKKIVISTWLYNKVKKYDSNVYLVRNYVDTNDFFVTVPIESRSHIVSLIQHPNPSKGTIVGIEALKIVKKNIPDLQVIMFGTHKPLYQLPNYYTYYENVNEDTLRNLIYNRSSIYILTSYLEGWGLTATEAMACGAALVSTKNGGVDDFGIHEQTALLSRPGDVEALARNIVTLLKNDSKRIRMGYAGESKVSKFTFEKSAKLFEEILLKE